MFGSLQRINVFKTKAIKQYRQRLPYLLRKDFFERNSYSVGQVEKTIERYGLNKKYSYYAKALYCDNESFQHVYSHKFDKEELVAYATSFNAVSLFAITSPSSNIVGGDGANMGGGSDSD